VEKAASVVNPQFRLQMKMKRVQTGLQRMKASGKNPAVVGEHLKDIGTVMDKGQYAEVEKLLDEALEMLGETEKAPNVNGQK